MGREIKEMLVKLFYPIRTIMGRFVITPSRMKNSLIYKVAAFMAADKIEGDYLEFGVYTGGSFIAAYKAIQEVFKNACKPNIWNTEQDRIEKRELWERMRFFAFDSFQGLPKPSGVDTVSRDFVEGKFSCSQDDFKRNVERQGVPLNRTVIVPGWFRDTLNDDTIERFNMKSAAIIYIDSDLYESAKMVLNFITPLLVDGTVIIFDDWYNFKGNPNLGEQRACREWLESNPDWILTQYQKEGPWKNSFIVNKKR